MILSVTEDEADALVRLGERLRRRRIAAAEPQTRAASRIGVSVPTYRKLEQGDASVPIGVWARALRIYGDLTALGALLPESLFDRDDRRLRAPRRRRPAPSRPS